VQFDQLKQLSPPNLAKLLSTITQWWRSPPLVKAAWAVILAGLGIMIPGIRDLALIVAVAAINWALQWLKRPPLPADTSAPWWAGLVLVVLGLLFLKSHARRYVRILRIEEKDGKVTIEGEIETSDPAEAQRLMDLMERRLKELTDEEPPGLD
jgi:hypothetical protein